MTTKPPFTSSTIITASLAGLVTLLVIMVILAWPQTERVDPAGFLPSGQTIALFQHLDLTKDRHRMSTIFPIFDSLPQTVGSVHVAIVVLPDKKLGWVIMPETRNRQPLLGGGERLQGFLTSGEPGLREMLLKKTSRLESFTPYAQLAATENRWSSWSYIDLTAVANISVEDRFALSLIGAKQYIAISASRTGGSIRTAEATSTGSSARIDTPLQPLFPRPNVVLRATDPTAFLQQYRGLLSPDRQFLMDANLHTWTRQTLGPDISLTYDLLPLLSHGPANLMIGTESGHSVFALLTTLPADTSQVDRVIQRLHTSYADVAPAYQIIRHTFDPGHGFSFAGIQEVPHGLTNAIEDIGTWHVQSTVGSENGLLTAINDSHLLITNAPSHARQWLAQEGGSAPVFQAAVASAFGGDHENASGLLTARWLNDLVGHVGSSYILRAIVPSLELTGIRWSISHEDNTATMTLEQP